MPKKDTSRASEVSVKSHVSKFEMGGGDTDSTHLGRAGKNTLLKPDDQLHLTEAELNEDIERELIVTNTRIPDNLVEWSYKLGEYIYVPRPPNIVTIINVSGTWLHIESSEAQLQLKGGIIASEEGRMDEDEGEEEDTAEKDEGLGDEDEQDEEENSEEAKADEPDEPDEDEEVASKPKKVPNQFNFCDRAALTYPIPSRDMTTQTLPPPTASCSGTIQQWLIYDAYKVDYDNQQREKDKERKVPGQKQQIDDPKKIAQQKIAAMNNRMLQAAKTLERMVNQNIYDEISQDYRYWNDPSDEFKNGEGSLLPLWKFSYEKTKKHDVTDVCFNTQYNDLFAVAFGSMKFDNPMTNGAICLFSLKNPSYPEWICTTETAVMCLDFNKEYPYLLVMGCMNGSVAVYNVMLPTTTPQYKSNDVTQKHASIVWQVCWAPDTEEGNMAFYSVSIDGKINYWVLNRNELSVTTVMTLFLDLPPIPGPDGTKIMLKACGTCIAFHPEQPNVFMVGTEEGSIFKCNTAYSSIYMRVYPEAHNMPVYRIVFNKYNSSIYASCSGDWRIKIWEDERPEPLFMFDLGVPIGDVQWAPYSSTVLACVSDDGKVTVFDLNVNKYRPICSQAVVSRRRNKVTRLAFSGTLPFIIVGDDKGTITTMKLSPNLRLKVKPTKKTQHLTELEMEIKKLEKLLSFVREPPVLIPPKDVKENNQ